MKQISKIVALLIFFVLLLNTADAQRKNSKNRTKKSSTKKTAAVKPTKAKDETTVVALDTISPAVVTITSAFKPVLRNAAKINFTAATPGMDSSRIAINYTIPSQNLFFAYQPVSIKPLALPTDSGIIWQNKQYIKLGYGNFSAPWLEAGFSFGDGKKAITNIHARYTGAKGNLAFQEFSNTDINVVNILNTTKNLEWTTRAFYTNRSQYLYGYQPVSLVMAASQIRQNFSTVGIEAGFQNKTTGEFGIDFHPRVNIHFFSDNRNAQEFNSMIKLPLTKSFGKIFAFDLGITADITRLKNAVATTTIANNLYYLNPSIVFKTPNFKLNAGIQPTWDNTVFSIMPNITAEAKIKNEKFIFMAGWLGYIQKNTYESLAGINPWLAPLPGLINTRIREQYAGFKGSSGSHFTYHMKLSFLEQTSVPLFVNDLADGKTFLTLFETEAKAIRLHGEVGYSVQEKFSFSAGATYLNFTSLAGNAAAFGVLPFELTGSLRWRILKDVQVKSDLFFWDGARYRTKTLQTAKTAAAIDGNLGIEYAIAPKINVWVQLNNIFNNRYQRWNQYEVLGFNALAGFIYSFK